MTTTATTKPNNYEMYRQQGFTQSQAFRMNTQDVIDWGVSQGVLESAWATPTTTKNDIAELVALLPENLVERFPDAEQRIKWIRTNYGVTLRMAWDANTIIQYK